MYYKLDIMCIVIARTLLSKCKKCVLFKIYTENRYMGTLSLAIVSSSISIAIGDGTETRSIQCAATRVITEMNGHNVEINGLQKFSHENG